MALAPEHAVIGIRRLFTTEGVHPYDLVEWERRDARIIDWRTGEPTFEQLGVEVPASWSVNAMARRFSRAASSTSSSGVLAPSRKLNAEWACSSA